MRLLERFIYKKTGYSYYSWDLWTKDEMLVCYMKLQGISQQMANDWRRWASAHLKAGQNYRSAIRALLYTLVYALLSALKAEAKKEAERTRP